MVDASQGVEAQTLADIYLAVESGLELFPCMNKVDLPAAEPVRVLTRWRTCSATGKRGPAVSAKRRWVTEISTS